MKEKKQSKKTKGLVKRWLHRSPFSYTQVVRLNRKQNNNKKLFFTIVFKIRGNKWPAIMKIIFRA